MAVKLRLVRMGKKKQPTYRVVAAESRRARSGAFLEIVGTYQPRGLVDRRARDGHPDRQREGPALAPSGRPADRARRQAAEDQRRPRHVRSAKAEGRPVSDVNDDYVAGDVNTIDDDEDDDDVTRTSTWRRSEQGRQATGALEFIATSLADDPSAVSVEVSERQGKVVLSLSVGADDMGRIIGRRGRTAQAIRALVGAAGRVTASPPPSTSSTNRVRRASHARSRANHQGSRPKGPSTRRPLERSRRASGAGQRTAHRARTARRDAPRRAPGALHRLLRRRRRRARRPSPGAASSCRPRVSRTTRVIWIDQLFDAEVVDADGVHRGVVVDVEANPASDLMVLDTGALVPLTFVVSVEANSRIDVDVPEGLFE